MRRLVCRIIFLLLVSLLLFLCSASSRGFGNQSLFCHGLSPLLKLGNSFETTRSLACAYLPVHMYARTDARGLHYFQAECFVRVRTTVVTSAPNSGTRATRKDKAKMTSTVHQRALHAAPTPRTFSSLPGGTNNREMMNAHDDPFLDMPFPYSPTLTNLPRYLQPERALAHVLVPFICTAVWALFLKSRHAATSPWVLLLGN